MNRNATTAITAPNSLKMNRAGEWMVKHWFRLFLLFLCGYIFFQKDVSIQLGLNTVGHPNELGLSPIDGTMPVALKTAYEEEAVAEKAPAKASRKKKWKDRKANTFSNLTFVLSPDYGERKGLDPAIAKEKVQVCNDYVKRYATTAVTEMQTYGIPASITLAQGLLESNAGDSRLSVESNNHFGIKCRSKCRGCTCRNYTDDDIYDMFRVFDSPWESFREHSKLLDTSRYRRLKKLGTSDYKGWAYGLKKAGYATDKRYAEKLIQIIEFLDLHRYDT